MYLKKKDKPESNYSYVSYLANNADCQDLPCDYQYFIKTRSIQRTATD